MKTANEMSKDEKSLLLYLETRAVDYGGKVDTRHMNDIDFDIAKEWNREGFVKFGRIKSDDIMQPNENHYCVLSDEAFELAHQERKNRSIRMWAKKRWKTTEE